MSDETPEDPNERNKRLFREATARMQQAFGIGGDLGLFRLRAETLLHYADNGRIPLTAERDELERICAAPNEADREFLNNFDDYLAAMDDDDDDA